MSDRVLIPTSDQPDGPEPLPRSDASGPGRRAIVLSVVAVLGVLALVAIATSGDEEAADQRVRSTDPLVPAEAPAELVVSLDAPFYSAVIPGRGSVVARLDVAGTDTIVVSSSGTSATWEEGPERWRLAETFDDFEVLDAVVFSDRLVLTGRSPLSRQTGVTYAGMPGAMKPVDLPFAASEYGYRLEVAGGALLVFTRSSDPTASVGAPPPSVADDVDRSVMWSTDGVAFSRLAIDRRSDVAVFDVLATDQGLRFYGHAEGLPAMWILERRSGRWVAGPEITPTDGQDHRVVSVVETSDARRLGLVVDVGDDQAPSTALWELGDEGWERIGDLGAGAYRDLLLLPGDQLVAVPEGGAAPVWSADGVEWERLAVATRGGDAVVESVGFGPERGLEVLGMSQRWRRPTIWSSPQAALTFDIPASQWQRIGPAEDGRYVLYVGDSLQLLWDDGVVVSRPDWTTDPTPTNLTSLVPVYAIPRAVDTSWGTVAVVSSGNENTLVTAADADWRVVLDSEGSRPVGAIAGLAAHEDRAMALVESGEGLSGLLVSESGATEIEVPTSNRGDAFGWVDRLGFTIVQTRESTTQIFSTRDGTEWWWSLLWDRIDSPVIVAGRLVGQSDGEWVEYSAGAFEPYRFEVPGASGDGVLWSDGRQATYSEDGTRWLTDDLEEWVRLELGFGGPSFGSLGRSWLADDAIVVESYRRDGPELFARPLD